MLKLSIYIILIVIILLSPFVISWYFLSSPVKATFEDAYEPSANDDNLLTHVKKLSDHLPERSDDIDKLNKSAEYILDEFLKYSKDAHFQNYEVWGITYKNVIAKFGNKACKGIYVIGAHYDSFDGLPGADDNASGVAGIIELARLFSNNPPKCKTQLVAYSLEEPPYFRTKNMGSYHHAKLLKDNNESVALMLSLEMIGYFSDKDESQHYPVSIMKMAYPSKGNFISLVSNFNNFSLTREIKKYMINATPLPVYSINAPPIIPGIDFSDHLNYWYFGFPAIMVTDTSFYRNDRYHTKHDTWQTLNYKKMAMVIDGVYQAVIYHMDAN